MSASFVHSVSAGARVAAMRRCPFVLPILARRTLRTNSFIVLVFSCLLVLSFLKLGSGAGTLPCINGCSAALDNLAVDPPIRHGACVDGVCHCFRGFYGSDCSHGTGDSCVNRKIKSDIKEGEEALSEDDDDNTCDLKTCSSVCAYGGACTSKYECRCYSHWGKGPSNVIDGDSSKRSNATIDDEPKSKHFYRKKCLVEEKVALFAVMKRLGVKIPNGDPCLGRWRNPRGFLMVGCNAEGHVTALDFGRMKLRGTIDPIISKMPFLRDVAMNNNLITGKIPESIGELQELENLLLYKNKLYGTIPSSLSRTHLINLVLYGNRLTGGIPVSFGYLFNTLLMLDVSFNRLNGEIPSSIWRMDQLQTMYINHNQLHGIIPKGVEQWSNIKNLRYEENKFDNDVKNVGNNEVFADQTHFDATEEWKKEWNSGIRYNRNRQRVFEQMDKKKDEEETKREYTKELSEKAEKKARGKAWLKKNGPKPSESSGSDEGGVDVADLMKNSGAESSSGPSGPAQPNEAEGSKEKAENTEPPEGMEIKHRQPTDTPVADERGVF